MDLLLAFSYSESRSVGNGVDGSKRGGRRRRGPSEDGELCGTKGCIQAGKYAPLFTDAVTGWSRFRDST